MMRSTMISFVVTLLAVFVTGAPMDDSECCLEKKVGDTFYTRISFTGGLVQDQCLNDCLYTITGTSEPKFCFARGELPVECGDSGYGLEFGSGYGIGYGSGYGNGSEGWFR